MSSVREIQAERELIPLVSLQARKSADVTCREADEIMTLGWSGKGRPRISLVPPIDWAHVCGSDRSWQYYLHAWLGLDPVLLAYGHTGERRYLDFALAMARDWATTYPEADLSGTDLAWYDMAVAGRAERLGYSLDAALRDEEYTDEFLEPLVTSVAVHLSVMGESALYAPHSNHGFYFAAGQLALCRRFPDLPGAAEGVEQAQSRLDELIESQFTSEGIHREHSPDYHRMVLASVRDLVSMGLLENDRLERFVARSEEALSWFVLPNGRLAMFGDSPERKMAWGAGPPPHPALEWTMTGGARGTPPSEPLRAFPESGYAFVRNRAPAAELDGYLAFNCAFHSRAHKHADDLSCIWYDRGTELLVDAGRFGYLDKVSKDSHLAKQGFWYGHPSRVYVESTAAHNTVEIDGRSFDRRNTQPYGSALSRWLAMDDLYLLEGETRQFGRVRHARLLVYSPAEWLLTFDWLWDDRHKPHDYVQRFHLAGDLAPGEPSEPRATSFVLPGDRGHLHVVPLPDAMSVTTAYGQEEPLSGWMSRTDGTLEPCWSVAVSAERESSAAFATLLALSDVAPAPGPAEISPSGRSARLAWADEHEHTLTFARPAEGELECEYERR